MNRARWGSLLALLLMLAGAAVMVYPYLYAVGGSLKTRAEFAADKRSVIPPRYQPATVARQFLGRKPDPQLAAQWRDWPPDRNYREAITFGQVDRYLGIIEQRCQLETSGAAWFVGRMHERGGQDRYDALRATLLDYRDRMHTNEPVHTWDHVGDGA